MGVPLTDEAELLAKAIINDPALTDMPICIDSSVVEALEAGLSVYQGRALVNSITAEDERMDADPPAGQEVRRRGDRAAQRRGRDPDGAREAARAGRRRSSTSPPRSTASPMHDIVIDPLAMPIGADTATGVATLETMRRIRDEFGLNMTCGASNVSFGMPERHALNAAFLPMAMTRRADQRDHGHPHPADRRGGQGRRPAARPRRVGHGLDRRAPRQARPPRPRQPRRRDATTAPDFSLDELRREGLLEPPAPAPPPHDGTGRVDLAFTVESDDPVRRPSARSGCRRASRSSTPRRGTASRSTPPAAATAPAASARSGSTAARSR